jgi:hypothetical protein
LVAVPGEEVPERDVVVGRGRDQLGSGAGPTEMRKEEQVSRKANNKRERERERQALNVIKRYA